MNSTSLYAAKYGNRLVGERFKFSALQLERLAQGADVHTIISEHEAELPRLHCVRERQLLAARKQSLARMDSNLARRKADAARG